MATSQSIRNAARVIDRGGVVAYPTEGVFGLGCLPDSFEAVSRILTIKKRDPGMGLVLIISDIDQLAGWTDAPLDETSLASTLENPVTWIVPAADEVPWWIRGDHTSIAVRKTAHPIAKALCREVDSPLVSTSANVSGRPPARGQFVLRRVHGSLVDYVVPGECGPARGPSEIRELESGKILRPA
ncbi:MAG: L-threonylcarbamoyladenylate synthase [Woeseiaceae bacterium]